MFYANFLPIYYNKLSCPKVTEVSPTLAYASININPCKRETLETLAKPAALRTGKILGIYYADIYCFVIVFPRTKSHNKYLCPYTRSGYQCIPLVIYPPPITLVLYVLRG